MENLANKKIILGVTGGIAAYKAAELVRVLRAEDAAVRVVMSSAAADFVTPLTFQALSGNEVYSALLDSDQETAMGHISLARWADEVLIAPATANFIAKLRIGIADDLLSTLCLATDAPISIAPAMNRLMWEHAATQENVRCLKHRGIRLFGPSEGSQACGESGFGRMMEPVDICSALVSANQTPVLDGLSVLISAGPTREPIDPVRYISNRSSGKMGYALAIAASEAGADVTLVSGPVHLDVLNVKDFIQVESARQMYEAVMSRAGSHDIYIGTAAVADYRPVNIAPTKIKKHADQTAISLEKNQDILASVASLKDGPFSVGFAAETEKLEEYARQKLIDKSVNMIAANWVGQSKGGFDKNENALEVFWNSGHRRFPMAQKQTLARQLIKLIAENFYSQHS